MAFRWHADDGQILNAGFKLVALRILRISGDLEIAKKPYNFVIFQGVGVRTPCPPLDPCM